MYTSGCPKNQNQENAGGHQHCKRRETHAGGDEPGPGAERQAHQAHAFHPKIKRRGNEVQRTQQLSHAKDGNGRRPKHLAQTLSRTCNRPDCTQGSILRPTRQGRTITHKKRRHHNQKCRERDPERHHVETGEGHILSAHLDRQEVIAEGSEWRRGQNKKDHDGAVHGHELQVIFRRHDVAGRTVLGKEMQPGNGQIGPAQMQAHDPGEHHPHEYRHQSESVVLLADHLVVEAENVLPNEALRRGMVLRRMCRYIVHGFSSNQRMAVLTASRRSGYCSAACFFSQSSKSACESTER
jgi:hypothetical protein